MRLWQEAQAAPASRAAGTKGTGTECAGPLESEALLDRERERELRGALLQEVSTRGAEACAEETGMTAWGNNARYLGITQRTAM